MNVVEAGVQQTPAPPSATKTSGKDDKAAASDGTDAGASAPSADQAALAAGSTSAVAAAIVVNAPTNTAPPAAKAGAATTAIGEAAKARITSSLLTGGSQDSAPAKAPADAAAPKQPALPTARSDGVADAPGNPAQAANGGSEPAPNGDSAQSPPTQAANDAASPPTGGPSSTDADHTAAQPAQSSTSPPTAASASNVQGGPDAIKSDANGLPNFGFPASPTPPATSTAAAPAGAAPTPVVPIAGLAVAISARALAGSNQFEIKLAPPELGRINVQLDIDHSGQVTSHITVERADTLQLLQSQQPQLQSALDQAGLKTADNGLQFTLGDQSFAGQNNGSGAQPAPTQLVIPEPDLPPLAATQIYARAGLGSGVDIRV